MRRSFLGRSILAIAASAAAALLIPGAASAAFPGLNGKIAYTHVVGMSSASIYTVNANGSSPTNLSAVGGGPAPDFQPAWSADGKKIAFVRVDFQNCSGQIWSMNANGTGQTNLSNDAATASEINPAYGPDGSIVFVRVAPHTFNICAPNNNGINEGNLWIRSPGGATRQLTTGGLDNTPAVSPDGTKIVFTRNTPGAPPSGPPHLFVMNANGSGTPKDLGLGVKPNWSPDGKKIVFAAPGTQGESTGGPVTVMNANGSHRQTLNSTGTAPAYSPDGTKIVYLTFSGGHSTALAVMNANGSGQHTISNPGSGNSDVKPDWQPVLRPLRFAVSPGGTTAGQRTCFSFRASSNGHGLAGVVIRFAGRKASTSRAGAATICTALSPGAHLVEAAKAGYRPATARVLATRRSRPPVFTG